MQCCGSLNILMNGGVPCSISTNKYVKPRTKNYGQKSNKRYRQRVFYVICASCFSIYLQARFRFDGDLENEVRPRNTRFSRSL
ncbi:hypothetical protein ASPWEDRAFT_136284 [Aspergillus wentii DTO 134E9]|uniref:Uncharacterized protein n=1 Tax=Aspergillus wentii DTO 134E9 TaxID=1073089 RepID=A0A1L9RHI9_ASPWE|nr:uncharacterized protein ASPWEDRAFT_136284 [Aspergillus wentii DTO 134E9]OJJ34338.1 hypothetical protein ASPWEDRAFT_136284 [Aspergillus wentii DTO 134E9]